MTRRLFARSLVLAALFACFYGTAFGQTLYWEKSEYVSRQSSSFPTTVQNATTAIGLWQEKRSLDGWPQFYLSFMKRSIGDTDWSTRSRVLGPFSQTGSDTQIYSAVLTKSGVLWVAVLVESGTIRIFRSDDQGATFSVAQTLRSEGSLLVPRLFLNPSDQPIFFVTQGSIDSFRIAQSTFDGASWSELTVVTDEPNERLNFQPFYLNQANKVSLFYQIRLTIDRPTYQIMRKDSIDAGKTWSTATRISDFSEDENFVPNDYDNQRPFAIEFGDRVYVAWERRTRGSQPSIQIVTFRSDGRRVDSQRLTTGNFTAGNPELFVFQNALYSTWFDNRREEYRQWISVHEVQRGWSDAEQLSEPGSNSVFGRPMSLQSDLFFLWQANFDQASGIKILKPDRSVLSGEIVPVNFKPTEKTNNKTFVFDVQFPDDPSGIAAYNYVVDRNLDGKVERTPKYNARLRRNSVLVQEEGTWYVHLSVQDFAGNWSTETTQTLQLKTTPPKAVLFDRADVDENGYLRSNTFALSWKPTSDDSRFYSWRLDRVGELNRTIDYARVRLSDAPASGASPATKAEFSNLENGQYALSVAAFDEAGNQGPTFSYFFQLNKFRPYTRIYSVDASLDNLGRTLLTITGRGFVSEGRITRVYLDQDARSPWDVELDASAFVLSDDRTIREIVLDNAPEGTYRVGVLHDNRGLVFTGPIVRIEPSGTVKVGDFRDLETIDWIFPSGVWIFFSVHAVYFWILIVFLTAIAVFSTRQLVVVVAQMKTMERQARQLFTDTYYQKRRLRREIMKRRKGLSLAVKFVLSILSLTITVILMLSLTLGFFIIANSQSNLGQGLKQRSEVLLESLSSAARSYLPSGNTLELSLLPSQILAMDDAVYATITGRSNTNKSGYSYVWATNDTDLSKLDTKTLQPGISTIRDEVEPRFESLQRELNAKASAAVGAISLQIDELTKKAQPYSTRTDAESQRILSDYQTQIERLQKQVNAQLNELQSYLGSIPEFVPENIVQSATTKYLFYKPIVYRSAGDNQYVKGLVRLEVSSDKILRQIASARDQLVLLTLLVALMALALGLGGAFLLSSLTINPIRKLVVGVEKIRDTDDKAELEGHVINVKTGDELADLAETINQMTQGLVAAAEANKDLLVGKDIQKTFIPLDRDEKGRKQTTGYKDLPQAEIFGYYEGAKGVSGDYFDFRQLDNREGSNPNSPWYGFIKCDVSGKGIPAALIMFQVATLVVKFFRGWTIAKDAKKISIKETVGDINDLVESLGYVGRFAALNMGILNVETGKIRLCHAGDNLVHVFRHATRTFETLTLPMAPATGQIADFMARSLYKDYDLDLRSGDTLFFYTDGIEEAKRYFRDTSFNKVALLDPENESTQVPVGTKDSIDGEDMNPDRIKEIITTFYSNGTYQLHRVCDPLGRPSLTFDFSKCDGSAHQAITALVAVEKIFRLVPDPQATKNDKIRVDVQIDRFLQKHFVEYHEFFPEGKADPQQPEYVVFEGLKEDDQFDDLTLLAIRKK